MSTIPVTLVTGFLGAGKTSFINHLLRDRAFKGTAVLINEFGDVAIDHDLVAEFSPELIVTTTGCLCCSASSEIKQSLFELWDRRRKGDIRGFNRVIVETTGLADPVPVVQSLLGEPTPALVDRVVCSEFALAHVLAMFDSIHGAHTLDEHPEAVKQLALADAVLMTKTDLPGASGLPRERLNQINPGAVILDRQQQWPQIRDLILAPRTYDLRSKGEDAIAWLNVDAALADHGHDHDHSHPHAHRHA